jgi:hypothetical protein
MSGSGLPPLRTVAAAARVAAALLLLLAAARAQPAAVPGLPATARIWFYQDASPYLAMNYATVSMNGVVVGSVPPYGGSIYRDVPPGYYHLTAESYGTDVNQSADVVLAPGQEVYVKVMNLPNWATANLGAFRRDTYYLRVMPPAVAQAELTQRRF